MSKKQFHQTDHLINSYPSLILNEIIIHRKPITEMKYLRVTDRNNILKETNFVKTVMFPFQSLILTFMPYPTFDPTFFYSTPETFPTTIADNDPIQHSLIPHYHVKHPK